MSSKRKASRPKGDDSEPPRKKFGPSYGRRGSYAGLVPRSIRVKSHSFKQVYIPSANALTVSGAGSYAPTNSGLLTGPTNPAASDMFFSLYFQLGDLPQVSTFSALFDAYRINAVKVTFSPVTNTQSVATTTSAGATSAAVTQDLETVIDYDDSTVLTAETDLFQYESYKTTPFNRIHSRYLKPKLSEVVYKTSGALMGYGQAHKWVDIANTDVAHYGIKGYCKSWGSANLQQQWRVKVKMYLECKQVR